MATRLANALLGSTEENVKEQNRDVLREFWHNYDSSYESRENYYRCKKFVGGDQWSDLTTYMGREMTEKEMLESQGRYPVVNNFLRILIRNYKGTYIKQDLEAQCKARVSEQQPLADALSTALQYNWDINYAKELLASIFEEGLIAPAFLAKVSTGIVNGEYDVWLEAPEFTRFIPDPRMRDPRGFDAEMLGEIHDMTKAKLISSYATSKAERRRINEIYKHCENRHGVVQTIRPWGKINEDHSFLFPDYGLCRVFEIWTKEHRDGFICHDFLTGEFYSIGEDEEDELRKENEKRMEQSRMAGVPEDEIRLAKGIAEGDKWTEGKQMPKACRLIKMQYYYEEYWYYRFMAPNGEIIKEGESPYLHKSHPYIFRFYPMIGGQNRSFTEDAIDLQKDVNRIDAMFDWIVRHSAKGALLFPRDQMDKEHGWDERRYADAWAQPDSVIPYKAKPGAAIPQQISKNNTDIGLTEMWARKTQSLQDITGIQGSLQGKTGYAGTSGTLYAQQTENATTSLLDLFDKFSSFIKEVAMKQISCMQQVYDEKKFEEICGLYGVDYGELKGIKNIAIFVRVAEGANNPAYRESNHNELHWLFQLGVIDAYTMLKNDPMPYSYKILRDKQEADQAAMAAGGQPLPSSVPQQNAMSSIEGANNPEAGANNMYNQMQKKQQ